MKELITIRTFISSPEAELAKSYLESCGIECMLANENMSRLYFSNVTGGVQLQVYEEDLDQVIDLLMEKGYLTEDDLEPSPELKWIDKMLEKFRSKKS